MKFEKHLKNTGLYGIIFTASNGDKYLRTGRNGNVLARVPAGFAPVGQPTTLNLEGWIDDILVEGAEDLCTARLFAAKVEKDGKAKDIRRVWADVISPDAVGKRRCEIDNTAFGLIERGDDVRIFDPAIDVHELEDLEPIDEPVEAHEVEKIVPALVILDRDGTVEAHEVEKIVPALVILDRDGTVVGIILEPWWED